MSLLLFRTPVTFNFNENKTQRLHYNLKSSLNMLSTLVFAICCFLCLDHTHPRYQCGSLPHIVRLLLRYRLIWETSLTILRKMVPHSPTPIIPHLLTLLYSSSYHLPPHITYLFDYFLFLYSLGYMLQESRDSVHFVSWALRTMPNTQLLVNIDGFI